MTPVSNDRPLAVVTGASSGIGYELAKQFAAHGFDLLIAAEDAGIVEAQQAFSQLGVEVTSVRADLATAEGVEELFSHVNRPVAALVLNAGVGVGGAFAGETDLAEEINLIKINCISPVYLAKRVLPGMIERNEGRILFTSSVAAVMPAPFEAVYGASKAFLLSFAEAIRNELKDTEVTVTALMPGPTETNFFHRANMDDTKVGQDEKDSAAQVAKDGFEALMSGRDKVVAGSFMNKVQATVAKLIPPPAAAAAHRQLSEPAKK